MKSSLFLSQATLHSNYSANMWARIRWSLLIHIREFLHFFSSGSNEPTNLSLDSRRLSRVKRQPLKNHNNNNNDNSNNKDCNIYFLCRGRKSVGTLLYLLPDFFNFKGQLEQSLSVCNLESAACDSHQSGTSCATQDCQNKADILCNIISAGT